MSNMNEQDPRLLSNQYHEIQKRAEMVQQQISMIQVSIEECNRALSTIEELSNVSEGDEMMFPIGSGSFVYANISQTGKAVVDIGAGVSVERPMGDAKDILQRRMEKLNGALERMNSTMAQLGQQMQSIESYFSKQQQTNQQQSNQHTPVQQSAGNKGSQ